MKKLTRRYQAWLFARDYQEWKAKQRAKRKPRRRRRRRPPVTRSRVRDSEVTEVEFVGTTTLSGDERTAQRARVVLGRLEDAIKRCQRYHIGVRVSFAAHDGFDAGALVRFMALVHEAKTKRVHVEGDYPRNPHAKQQLIDVGFLAGHSHGNRSVRLQIGTKSSPTAAGDLANFVGGTVGLHPRHPSIQALRLALQECIENVAKHARRGPGAVRWYALGYFHPAERVASVAICDVGIGIPASYPRTLSTLRNWVRSDLAHLLRAVSGTSSRGGGRGGKGLKGLRDEAEALSATFGVHSARAAVTLVDGEQLSWGDLHLVRGTIVVFSVRAPLPESNA